MNFKYLLLLILVISGIAAIAQNDPPESQLANIKIGLKRDKLVGILGPPSGIFMAQPAIDTGIPNEKNPDPRKTPYNSLMLITNIDGLFFKNSERVIGPDGIPETVNARSYWWTETVRPTRLTLDQRVLIYWINDTYVMAFTFKGDGPDAPLSDITACSFEPFLTAIGPGSQNVRKKPLNFMYRYKTIAKEMRPTTSKQVTIGDKMDSVLVKYGWPEYYYPFVPEQLPPIRIKNGKYLIEDMQAVVNASINSGLSANDPTGMDPTTQPPTNAPGLNNTGTTDPANTDKYKPPQAMFAWMVPIVDYPVTFSKSCFMIYPKQGIAFTIVNLTVTRIQMGLGVVPPPTPDVPQMYWPFMSGASASAAAATTATPPMMPPVQPGFNPNPGVMPPFGGNP